MTEKSGSTTLLLFQLWDYYDAKNRDIIIALIFTNRKENLQTANPFEIYAKQIISNNFYPTNLFSFPFTQPSENEKSFSTYVKKKLSFSIVVCNSEKKTSLKKQKMKALKS